MIVFTNGNPLMYSWSTTSGTPASRSSRRSPDPTASDRSTLEQPSPCHLQQYIRAVAMRIPPVHDDLMNVLLGDFVSGESKESRIVLGHARSPGDGASDRPGLEQSEAFSLALWMRPTSDGKVRFGRAIER
jgi:hypothetical protein